jgi:hypothetical protein
MENGAVPDIGVPEISENEGLSVFRDYGLTVCFEHIISESRFTLFGMCSSRDTRRHDASIPALDPLQRCVLHLHTGADDPLHAILFPAAAQEGMDRAEALGAG